MMQLAARQKLVRAIALVLGMAALALAVFAFYLIRAGAYPPEGTGSLGHVGTVIAGLIAAFLALVLGLIAVWVRPKLRSAHGGSSAP
jgi:hypothetical protein